MVNTLSTGACLFLGYYPYGTPLGRNPRYGTQIHYTLYFGRTNSNFYNTSISKLRDQAMNDLAPHEAISIAA